MNEKDIKRKRFTKWIIRGLLTVFAISLIMYSLFMTVENSMYRNMLQENYQNDRKIKKAFESERAAYQDTIKTLRQNIEIK